MNLKATSFCWNKNPGCLFWRIRYLSSSNVIFSIGLEIISNTGEEFHSIIHSIEAGCPRVECNSQYWGGLPLCWVEMTEDNTVIYVHTFFEVDLCRVGLANCNIFIIHPGHFKVNMSRSKGSIVPIFRVPARHDGLQHEGALVVSVGSRTAFLT